MTIPGLEICTGPGSVEYTSHPEHKSCDISSHITASCHLVPGPGHAAAGVPAQLGALAIRTSVLIIAHIEILTIAEDNIRLHHAAL